VCLDLRVSLRCDDDMRVCLCMCVDVCVDVDGYVCIVRVCVWMHVRMDVGRRLQSPLETPTWRPNSRVALS